MNAPLYTIDILRLAADLPAPRLLEREDGRAELRSPTCGSVVAVAVQLDADGRVEALGLEVQACAFGQASSALMARSAAGRKSEEVAEAVIALTDWLEGKRADSGAWPGLEALAPARSRKSRHGAILLPFRALLAAIEGARP
ncbi:MAG TPA: iron-sulfur cluster assembly scaffold protein [Sphingomicrobium sp.]